MPKLLFVPPHFQGQFTSQHWSLLLSPSGLGPQQKFRPVDDVLTLGSGVFGILAVASLESYGKLYNFKSRNHMASVLSLRLHHWAKRAHNCHCFTHDPCKKIRSWECGATREMGWKCGCDSQVGMQHDLAKHQEYDEDMCALPTLAMVVL